MKTVTVKAVLPGIVAHGCLVGFEIWPGVRRHYVPANAPLSFSRVGRRGGRDLYAVTIRLPKRVVAAWRGHPWWVLWDLARDWTVSAGDQIFRAAHDPMAALYYSYSQGHLLVVNRIKAWRLKRFWAGI